MATVAEDEAVDGAAAETLETQEAAEHSLNTSAQDASPQNAPVSPLATTDAAEEATNSYATAAEAADPGGGMVEEPHYASARGLRPNPAARALAGPTVHILLEGYVSPSAAHLQVDRVVKLVVNTCCFCLKNKQYS